MTETVTSDLSRIAGLMVISPASAAAFLHDTVDVRQVSRELGVRFVLKGSVQRSGPHVRINAQLNDGPRGIQIWSQIFDGNSSELFELQDRITGAIANSMGRHIAVVAARDAEAHQTDLRCWDLIMRGIAADSKPQSLECLREQEAFFAQAVQLDPKNSVALAWLARAILLQARQLHAPAALKEDALLRGGRAAEHALALDPNNARAHLAMSYLHGLHGDLDASLVASERAVSLDRNLAMAHNMVATSLVHLGRGEPAIAAAENALRLDPMGPQLDVFLTTLGLARLQLRQIDKAVECFSRARAANPKLARAHLGAAIAFALDGDVSRARAVGAELLSLAPDFRLSQTVEGCLPSSPRSYTQFYEEVLAPGARIAGVPL
jgi:tetratricopeptide (TPR) repeat protein